ncbi:MAG: hypothetical protein QOK43_1574 [Acidimicrobiaceae bacterium]|nr:hypothetical protein [Acidimicrobiaceae bacterium]
MARDVVVETRDDRAALAADAGMGRISFGSVLAGTLVAYGAFAVLAALTAVLVRAVGVDRNLSTDQWRQLGVGGGIAVALVLFLSYFYGGYVAGRMARRGGVMNGLLVFFLGVVVAVGIAGLAKAFTDGDAIVRNLRSVGVPTSASEWRDIGTVAGIGSLVAMILGSVLGGAKGERWHGKLLARAWDPEVGEGVPVNPGTRHATVVDDGSSVMTTRRDTEADRVIDVDRDAHRSVTTDSD